MAGNFFKIKNAQTMLKIISVPGNMKNFNCYNILKPASSSIYMYKQIFCSPIHVTNNDLNTKGCLCMVTSARIKIPTLIDQFKRVGGWISMKEIRC